MRDAKRYVYPILVLLLVVTQARSANEPVLSIETRSAIRNVFGTDQIKWVDQKIIRIENLNHFPSLWYITDGEPFVEGNTVVSHIRILDSAKIVSAFVNGNKNPFVGSLIVGPSAARLPITMSATVDTNCGGRYSLVVVQQVNKTLFAQNIHFRTHIADCNSE